jgi:hypothetical protein
LLGISAGPLDAFMAAQTEQTERLQRMCADMFAAQARQMDAIRKACGDMVKAAGLDLAAKAVTDAAAHFSAVARAVTKPFQGVQRFLQVQAERVRSLLAGLAAVARGGVHRVRRIRGRLAHLVTAWRGRLRRRQPVPLRPPALPPVGLWSPSPVSPAPIARHGFTITPNGPPMLPSHDYATDRRLPI